MEKDEKGIVSPQKGTQGVIPGVIEDELKKAYIDYAMSVIVGRALPDVRDGLKPVHRRILFAMHDMGIKHNTPFKKCARIVGEVLGKYHPHGDVAVYDSLVRMAQNFSLRYPLIDSQGNFGSIDGDNAAAMRYTEARLKKIATEMLQDIDKETVGFIENFDGEQKEPVVLPSKIPNILINGSSGIAVGMATNIPPHNLREVCQGMIMFIQKPEISLAELASVIKGPDFPTAAIICGRQGIFDAYRTGRGKITVRARIEDEEKKGKRLIVVKEIPYMQNKALLVEEIASNIKEKRVEGISDLRDESSSEGIRIVMELKKDAQPDVVRNMLLKYTRLQDTFSIRFLALVNNEPKILGLREILANFRDHRKSIVVARTTYELNRAEKRVHILDGVKRAIENIDPIVQLIKASKSASSAKDSLISNYSFSEEQATAILDMKLQKIAALERSKIEEEHRHLNIMINEYRGILASEQKVLDIITGELQDIASEYGDDRRTEILDTGDEIDIEGTIKDEDVIVTISHSGYIKRQSVDTYKLQNRGGRGIVGASTKEEDFIEDIFIANTLSYLLVFSDKGSVYWLKVFSLPQGTRQSRGKPIVNLLSGLASGEKIAAVIPVKQFDNKHFLIMATKNGLVKKTNLEEYSRPRKSGIIAINIGSEDGLIGVALTDSSRDLMLATKDGNAVRFNEKQVRTVGRNSKGVRGATLRKGDELVAMIIADPKKAVLTVTENGYGKKSPIADYRHTNRGGKGVINIKCSERNGRVVSIIPVDDSDELIFVSRNGIIIRTKSSHISTIGRNTQGVRLMRISGGDKLVSVAAVQTEGDGGDNDHADCASQDSPHSKGFGHDSLASKDTKDNAEK